MKIVADIGHDFLILVELAGGIHYASEPVGSGGIVEVVCEVINIVKRTCPTDEPSAF